MWHSSTLVKAEHEITSQQAAELNSGDGSDACGQLYREICESRALDQNYRLPVYEQAVEFNNKGPSASELKERDIACWFFKGIKSYRPEWSLSSEELAKFRYIQSPATTWALSRFAEMPDTKEHEERPDPVRPTRQTGAPDFKGDQDQ